jgi:hypothetical protein
MLEGLPGVFRLLKPTTGLRKAWKGLLLLWRHSQIIPVI